MTPSVIFKLSITCEPVLLISKSVPIIVLPEDVTKPLPLVIWVLLVILFASVSPVYPKSDKVKVLVVKESTTPSVKFILFITVAEGVTISLLVPITVLPDDVTYPAPFVIWLLFVTIFVLVMVTAPFEE